MKPEEFAAKRRARLTKADEDLHPTVQRGLEDLIDGQESWDADIIADAAVLWLEVFEEEAPEANRGVALARFRKEIAASLDKTAVPDPEVGFDASVNRVTYWLSTYTVNNATMAGALRRGVKFKRWTTMGDSHVRELHDEVDGQIAPIGGTFDVGGSKLAFPGEPVGPPEVWINCRCLAMPAARDGETMSGTTYTIGPQDEVEENPDIVEGYDIIIADATFDMAGVIADAPPELEGEDLVPDEPDDDEELITEIPVHGIAAPEGVPTGDGREFALDSLSWRDLPLPILYQPASTEGHDMSYVTGRIDQLWKDDQNRVRYTGAIVLSKQFAGEVIDGIIDGTIRGVSVDVDDIALDLSEILDETGAPIEREMTRADLESPEMQRFSRARIAALTVVAIPAFQEAYIALGHEFEEDLTDEDRAALAACGCLSAGEDIVDLSEDAEANARAEAEAEALVESAFAPGTHDGPGWITHPVATKRIRDYWVKGKGAAKIRWGVPGDFNRCRLQLAKYVQNPDWLAGLCANMHREALGIWPAQHRADAALTASATMAERAPMLRFITAAATKKAWPAEWFANPQLERAVPLRIEPDTRRIYGYIAEWGSCHLGILGVCQDPPPSNSEYAWFRRGVVDTTAGEQPVATLTYGIGHASERMRASAATAHYDQTDAVRAYVNVGEDEFGIWFAGVLAPWVGKDEIDAMRAIGSLSGDWREVRGDGDLEMIGAVFVAVPAFPLKARVAASAEYGRALIAAGRLAPEPVMVASATIGMDPELVGAIARTAVAEYRHQEKVASAVGPARAKVRERTLATARARVERG